MHRFLLETQAGEPALFIAMESVANFTSRAKEIGMAEGLIESMKDNGVNTFSKLAYICSSNPTSGDDSKLKEALEALIGRVLTPVEMISIRQLWFESYTFAMTELEERVKKTPSDTPKALPMAERLVRIEKQKNKLTGLIFDQFTEPAHSLTDKAHAMVEDGVLTYLSPEISRHDEIQNQKSEHQVTFDGQGNLKISKKASELSCDTSGELRIRQALTRRSLAMDQAGLCTFSKMEKWHTTMMHATMRTPPSGHKYVTMQQVLSADKELWGLMSQETRGQLKVAAGQDPPLDVHMATLSQSPQVLCFMTPLPAGKSEPPKGNTPPPPKQVPKSDPPQPRTGQPPFKRKFEGGKGIKDLLQSMPSNCTSKLDLGKFICLHYNNGTCKKQKSSSCNMGAHVCYYKGCHKKRPYIECSH